METIRLPSPEATEDLLFSILKAAPFLDHSKQDYHQAHTAILHQEVNQVPHAQEDQFLLTEVDGQTSIFLEMIAMDSKHIMQTQDCKKSFYNEKINNNSKELDCKRI
jgi:hypothetical protein